MDRDNKVTYRVLMVMEFEAEEGQAMTKIDKFREDVLPSLNHGITISRATPEDLPLFSTVRQLGVGWIPVVKVKPESGT